MVGKISEFIKKVWKNFLSLSIKKKLFLVALIFIFILIGSFLTNKKNDYITEKVTKGKITEFVTETGSVIDEGSIKVYSPSTGIVEELFVRNGEIVVEGQELFSVKSTATEQEKQQANASYLKAASDLAAAQANSNTLRSSMYSAWENYRDLATNSTYEDSSGNPKNEARLSTEFQTAQDEWVASEKLYKNSQTQIAAAQAAVTASNLAYQATQNAVVKAQTAGVIQNLSISQGGSVQANVQSLLTASSVNPALLITTAKTRIKTNIGQTDISKVKPGQKVVIDPDAFQDIQYEGVVESVDEIGTDTSGVVEYSVYISINDDDGKLKSGMTLDAEIETDTVENVLTVSNSAVVLYKGGRAVRIAGKNGEIEYVPVQVGIRGNERTQILQGVTLGQEIITSLSNEQLKRPGLFGN